LLTSLQIIAVHITEVVVITIRKINCFNLFTSSNFAWKRAWC